MTRSSDTVIVVAGGGPPDDSVAGRLPRAAAVIAADSGLEHAARLGLAVDVVVGDMDSVSPTVLDQASEAGVEVQRHPTAKEATDLELALEVALARGPARLVVVAGGDPGRFDHVLSVVLLLGSPRLERVEVEAWMGRARLTFVRGGGRAPRLVGGRGDLVTLLPLHGSAGGVTTTGLLFPLTDEDLPPGTTRGVSNEMLGEAASVRARSGALVVVQPGERGVHLDAAER